MSIIKRNPFRILGILSNSSEKEIQKRISIVKRYSEVGKTKTFDYDFEFLGPFERNIEEIHGASNKIEQVNKKLIYSLFWFVNKGQFDDIAFNHLKGSQVEKAIEIWEKTIKTEVSDRNYTSYHNLSSLYIALYTAGESGKVEDLQKAFDLKAKLFLSDYVNNLSQLITNTDLTYDLKKLIKEFADEVVELFKPFLKEHYGLTANQILSFFNNFPIEIKKHVSKKFTDIPISNIEANIEKTLKKRADYPKVANTYGEKLYNSTGTDLSILKDLLGFSDLNYKMIANKLANEILQCSITYFNSFRDDENIDPGVETFKIIKYAQAIEADGSVKNRIDENIDFIKTWISEQPKRDKEKKYKTQFIYVVAELDEVSKQSSISLYDVERLLNNCKPKLLEIKNIIGRFDPDYIKISTTIGNYANGIVVNIFNNSSATLEKDLSNQYLTPMNKRILIQKYLTSFEHESKVLKLSMKLDLEDDTKNRISENKRNINETIKTLNNIIDPPKQNGCYIATMAYGDYNHPQVMILRKFRDRSLSKTVLGRLFIKFYYATSPHLVKLLKNSKTINKSIRSILDKLIQRIEK